jgi:tetratricopeptide (TPR) repeat protein
VRPWALAADPQFEVYSQAGSESARTALAWFEQLRTWIIRETGLKPDRLRPARVIGFARVEDYQQYRLHTSAAAYYVGTEGRDYIVMVLAGPNEFGIAAHEYAHLVLHSTGWQLPPWLGEGMAELFGTVRITERGATLGGDRTEHLQNLRHRPWMPIAQLLRLTAEAHERQSQPDASMFYAQSWALAEMLSLSPDYQPRLRALIPSLASGVPGDAALVSIYGRPLEAITADLQLWVERRRAGRAVRLNGAASDTAPPAVDVDPQHIRLLLAGLLLDAGEWRRAEPLYRDLLREAPENGDVHAALGTLALQSGDLAAAQREWQRAIEDGITDDALCFRYWVLAQNAGVPAETMRPILERAIALRPQFDDARYSLALLLKNSGDPEQAVEHLRAMREVTPARAFAYWAALSDGLNSLERFDEAEAAAKTAGLHAATAAERGRALELIHIARTEVAVQLDRDSNGRPRMVTTRIPRRTPDWNPFVQPGDDVRRAEGLLREIDCSTGVTRILLDTAGGPLALAIADPTRVQMRNAPPEFTCGAQTGNSVTVVYAASQTRPDAAGTVRGIDFR